MADIAARSPFETLGPESRYVVAADLRMGDGGKHDELAMAKKALFAILGRWYLPRGYTLVLDGDVEDLRGFWLKDILAAWPEIYALFDAFSEQGRLRKIVGERDLALLRLSSYPYELSHGLRLDGDRSSILVLHGHQASPPFAGRDYLSDYIQHWLGTSKRTKGEAPDEDGRERFKAERRLYRAASSLGMAVIQGHTRRPLFESLTNRDAVRAEVKRLLGAGEGEGGLGAGEVAVESPCLFCPGRVLGARGLRFLEIEGDRLGLVRWSRTEGRKSERKTAAAPVPSGAPLRLDGSPYSRFEVRSTSICGMLGRVELLATRPDGDPSAAMA